MSWSRPCRSFERTNEGPEESIGSYLLCEKRHVHGPRTSDLGELGAHILRDRTTPPAGGCPSGSPSVGRDGPHRRRWAVVRAAVSAPRSGVVASTPSTRPAVPW